MFKDTLKTAQPTVYRILFNALEKKKLSHCYLFVGQKGTLKKETAFFLAQSLVCEQPKVFACENCITCQRVLNDNYVDLLYIDGTEKTIKIEQIENLQTQFAKTALEMAGKKVFIIDGCENMTLKAANSLLKFIEEPEEDTLGIFITTQVDRILPTIVSRCQTINFKPLTKETFYTQALQLGYDELNSHYLSFLVNETSQISTLATSKPYINGFAIFFEFASLFFTNRHEAILYLQNRFSKLNKNDKNNLRDTIKYFLEISLLFVSDYLNDYTNNDETYNSLIKLIKGTTFNYELYLETMTQTRDALNKSANGLLLIDQMLYKLMEV